MLLRLNQMLLHLHRAIVPADATTPQMVIDMGEHTTDLVILHNGSPKLTRSIPTGIDSIIKSAIQNLNIDEKAGRAVCEQVWA